MRTSTPKHKQHSSSDLSRAFEDIKRRGKETEVEQLLTDMLEAGELEPCEERSYGRVRYWKAARNSRFADRPLLIENIVRECVAELFLRGEIIFTVDEDIPP